MFCHEEKITKIQVHRDKVITHKRRQDSSDRYSNLFNTNKELLLFKHYYVRISACDSKQSCQFRLYITKFLITRYVRKGANKTTWKVFSR